MSMCNLYHAIPRPCRLTALALVLAMAGGCGSGNTSPVKGKVVFKDGSPLTGGLVLFKPVEPPIIHPRFTSHETSGLEFDVTRKKNDFTIYIDKP